jgi:hypothetical protein
MSTLKTTSYGEITKAGTVRDPVKFVRRWGMFGFSYVPAAVRWAAAGGAAVLYIFPETPGLVLNFFKSFA